MQMIARSYLVYELTSSVKILALVSAASGVPMLALALFGGAIADRVQRKRLVQAAQVTSMAVALFIAISISTDTITWYHLLGTGLVQGSLWSFMEPARQALIPQLVGQRRVSNALALNGAGMSASILVMPAVGGVLYAVIGPGWVYYIIAGMIFTAAMFTTAISVPAGNARQASSDMLTDIKAGLTYIWRTRVVLVLLLIGTATVLLSTPFKFLLPVFVDDLYNRESGAFGLLVSMMGLGTLVGSLFIASLGRWRRGLLLIAGTFASGFALLLVWLFPIYYAAVGIMVMLGLGEAGRRVLNQALIMDEVESQYQGRVMSVYMMSFGLVPLGVLPAGLAIDLLGSRTTVAILGAAMVSISLLLLATQRRIRSMQ